MKRYELTDRFSWLINRRFEMPTLEQEDRLKDQIEAMEAHPEDTWAWRLHSRLERMASEADLDG